MREIRATTFRSRDGDILDEIALARYGQTTGGAVELILDANPEIRGFGPVLPAGVIIRLPDWTPPAPAQPVRLWD